MDRWHTGDRSPTPQTVGGGGWWMEEAEAGEVGSGPEPRALTGAKLYAGGGVRLIRAERRARADSCWNGGGGREKKFE